MNKNNKRTIMKQFLIGLLMVFTTMTGYSQIAGTGIDEEANQPLPGATVVIKGTQIGTTTDFDGLFSISEAKAGDTLVITFIGFDAAEEEAYDGMEVVLQTALNQLIRHDKPDRILIEPSGLGHVDNIVKLLQDESYQIRLHLNGVVCVIDSRHLSLSKYRFHALYLRQIYAADLFVANKSELLTEHELKQFNQLCSEWK